MVGGGVQTGRVIVDGWLEMNAPAQTAVLFKELRGALDTVLQERIGMPQVHAFDSLTIRFHLHQLSYLQTSSEGPNYKCGAFLRISSIKRLLECLVSDSNFKT